MDYSEAYSRVLGIIAYKTIEWEEHMNTLESPESTLAVKKAAALALDRLCHEIDALKTVCQFAKLAVAVR